MALARVQSYFIKSKIAQFFSGQSLVNQIVLLIGAGMSIPFIFNLQIFQLFSILRDIIQGYEVNNLLLLTLLSELGLLFYSIYLYTHWAYREEKQEAVKVQQDFSIPPDFLIIEEYKPILLDGKSVAEVTEIGTLVKKIDVEAIIAANADPLSFFDRLRPINDALHDEAQRFKKENQTEDKNDDDDDDLMSGTLFDIMKKAERQKQTQKL